MAKVRSKSGQKRSNFEIDKFEQKRYLSGPVFAQESNGVIYFSVRCLELSKIAFENLTSSICMFLEIKSAHLVVKN